MARTVVVNVPQHLTQCGEGRQSLPRARRKAGNFPSVPGFQALNEGSTAVEHANPKEGKAHFHPGDAKGNKKPGSTHHTYGP
jgi:hypothetical protein